MTPGVREEIEKVAKKVLSDWNPHMTTHLMPKLGKLIEEAILAQVEKALAESKYIPSELELFTILKKAYYENSELTGDQLWLKLSKSIRAFCYGAFQMNCVDCFSLGPP